MATMMIELREVDRDEMARVEGGGDPPTGTGPTDSIILPWPVPPGRAGHPPIVDP
jgi:hypothetical protein